MSQTLNDRLEAYLKAHANRWIAATEFEYIAGRQAWRTRLSDCRRQRGMRIENRVRPLRLSDGRVLKISEYIYVPAQQESHP